MKKKKKKKKRKEKSSRRNKHKPSLCAKDTEITKITNAAPDKQTRRIHNAASNRPGSKLNKDQKSKSKPNTIQSSLKGEKQPSFMMPPIIWTSRKWSDGV